METWGGATMLLPEEGGVLVGFTGAVFSFAVSEQIGEEDTKS